MNGYFTMAGILLVLCCLPYVRIFCKRISLYLRLRRICRKRNFKLYGTHFGWLFSPWQYPRHDFVVEGDHTIYAVKLFASKSKTRKLVVTQDGSFYWGKRIVLMSRGIPTLAQMEITGKPHKLPDYDFSVETDAWSSAYIKPVLLVNPVCHEFYREYVEMNAKKEELLGSWEWIGHFYLCSSSRFLDELETYDHQKYIYR